jgi:Ser/Thr protein kinase RdoA (MazF antagonist)
MHLMSAAAAAAIAASYDLGVPDGDPVYATRGEQGLIWRLNTQNRSWAVKELLLPATEAAAAADVRFQLAARAAGIPLPLPRYTREGRVVLPADEAGSPGSVRVYEWADLADGPLVSGAEIGALAARLHRVQHADPKPVEEWFSEPAGRPAWQALLAGARQAGASWAQALGQVLPDLVALDALAAPPDPAALTTCHRDLNTENILRAGGGSVIVVDWENSGPAQPERELAAIIADLDAGLGLQAAREAYASYQAAGGPARLSGPTDFAMAVAVQGHLLPFYGQRALNRAETPQTRNRARKRLDHILHQPLTISRIDRLLHHLAR